jgi:SnoaL-like domain
MELWELAARESIRDVIARYNANGDSARWDDLEELFDPDAVMDIDGTIYEGRAAIMGMFRATQTAVIGQDAESAAEPLKHTTMAEWIARGNKPFIRHFTSTTQIDVTGETTATARSYYLVIAVHGVDHWGRYVDEFRHDGSRWRFSRRTERLDAAVEGGFADGASEVGPRTVRTLAHPS